MLYLEEGVEVVQRHEDELQEEEHKVYLSTLQLSRHLQTDKQFCFDTVLVENARNAYKYICRRANNWLLTLCTRAALPSSSDTK